MHDNGATGQYFMPEIMGGGAALFDYDGDGDADVFLVQGGDPADPSRSVLGAACSATKIIPVGKLRFFPRCHGTVRIVAQKLYGMGVQPSAT